MPKKMFALIGAICLMSILSYGWIGYSQSVAHVQLTTDPIASQILPFEAEATEPQSPIRMTLSAKDAVGKPLENAKIHLTLLTPAKNPWLTTDFPIVEGTKLLELEAIAPTGEVQFQQMLPIRGTYQLQVEVTPIVVNSFTPIQQTLSLSIPENGVKYRNFAILALILLAVGLGGGWIIGGRQFIQPGEIVPQSVRLLLSGAIVIAIAALLFVNISAEMSQSHMSMPMSHATEAAPFADQPDRQQSQGLDVQLSGDNSAVVGQLAKLQASVVDTQTGQPATDVRLKITAMQLESSWVTFAYEGIPDATGQLAWQQQFFDGAPHRIQVEAVAAGTRQFQPIQVAKTLEVEGVAPPLSVRITGLAYLTGIVLVGLLIGLKLRRSQPPTLRQNPVT
jgi:hypothetical protein